MATVPVLGADEAAEPSLATEAAFGTPVIDGEIDGLWDKTNYNVVERNKATNSNEYKGWFKLLWDNSNMYVLAKVYTTQFNDSTPYPWNNDSFEIFIDENCGRTAKYEENDYQLRSDFKGEVSASNFDVEKIKSVGKCFDNYYIVEMAFPFKTVSPAPEMVMGMDAQINAAATLAFGVTRYAWNGRQGDQSSSTVRFGTVTLKNAVNVANFREPEWIAPKADKGYSNPAVPDTFELIEGVTVKFDDKTFNYPILHVNEYPSMEIGELASVIGGSTDGTTLIKDGVRIKYTEGSRLAEYGNGHLMLERKPVNYQGRFYVPVSSLLPTLCYHMEYNRFGKTMQITTGTNYPATELTFNVADFGAVGDGVHDDKEAILKALDAAFASGKPSEIVFGENKTYFVSERMDAFSFLDFYRVNNITLEGNGSKLLLANPTNSFVRVDYCNNIKIRNLSVEYMENCSSWGTIKSIDMDEGSMLLEIPENMPLPAANNWVQHFSPDGRTGGWWFGQLFDPVKDRLKFTYVDNYFVDAVYPHSGRTYKVIIRPSQARNLQYAEIGDRFVLNTRYGAYDMSDSAKEGGNAGFTIRWSSDVVVEGVNVYDANGFFASVGMCPGRIKFINSGMLTKDGDLLAVNSDGIHYWRCRGGLVVDGCTFMNNLDDHINTKGEEAVVLNKINARTFEVDWDQNYREGDEILFFDPVECKVIGKAYLKSWSSKSGRFTLTVDRDIEGVVGRESEKIQKSTIVYNVDCSARGTVIRNSKFMYSRRYAYISRSQNTVFENNEIIDCGASMVCAQNEINSGSDSAEGPFPSSFTCRNNIYKGDGMTYGYYPLEVTSFKAPFGATAAIDGFLLENNEIDVACMLGAMNINSVENLYMINNTIKCDKPLASYTRPVSITNSKIALIDGLNFDYKQDVGAVITIAGCEVDESNIKNVNVISNNANKKYTIE